MAVENPAASPRKDKKDKGDKCGNEEKGDKPHGLESKSGSKTASQEQVQESLHHSQCLAGSSTEGSHHKSHKKSKKHGKKLHKSHKKSSVDMGAFDFKLDFLLFCCF